MLGLLATLVFLAATLFALVSMTITVQGSWTKILSALRMDVLSTRVRRRHAVRVNRSFRPAALAPPSPRALSAAA